MANNWKYLEHPIFAYRSVIAADYLKDCNSIIEIGGFVNPIAKFMDNDKYQITIIDQFPPEFNIEDYNIDYKQTLFENVDFSFLKNKKYGVLFLGMHFDLETTSTINKFRNLFFNAHKAVFAYPTTFPPSVTNFNAVTQDQAFTEHLVLTMDFSENSMAGYDDKFPPYLQRKLHLIRL